MYKKKLFLLQGAFLTVVAIVVRAPEGHSQTLRELVAALDILRQENILFQIVLLCVLGGLVLLFVFGFHQLRRLQEERKHREKIEQALQICDRRFEAMVRYAPTCILLYDSVHKHFVEANPKAVEVLGYSREEFCAMDWLEIAASRQQNDTPADIFFNDLIATLPSHENEPARVLAWLKTRDNTYVCVDLLLDLLADDGTQLVRASFLDTTSNLLAEKKLKESEEKYRLLFEVAHDPMLLLDRTSLRIEAANTAAAYMTGRTATDLLSHSLIDISTSLKRNDPRLETIRCHGDDSCHIDLWHFRGPQQTVIPTEVTARSFSSTGGEKTILSIRDIRERFAAEKKMKAYRERLQKLTGHLQQATEQERTRVAREVHDELGQVLSALKMDLHRLRKKIDRPTLTKTVDNMLHMVEDAIKSVQRICTNLRPTVLDHLGPGAAIIWLVMEAEKRSNITIKTQIDPETIQPSHDVATALFRIVQECLTNIIRHAHATEAFVRLTTKGEKIFFEINDNGCGFELYKVERQKKFGLASLRERACMFHGELKITTAPGEGTRITGWLPTCYEEKNDQNSSGRRSPPGAQGDPANAGRGR